VNNTGRRRFAKEFSISKPKRWLEKLAVSKNIPLHIIQQYHAGRRECAPCVKKQTCVACRKKREIAAAAAAASYSCCCRTPSPQKLEEEETRRNSSMNKARGILLHIKHKSDAGIINAMTVPIVSESTTTVVQAEERRYAPEANQGNAALLEEWKNLMNRGRRRWLSLLMRRIELVVVVVFEVVAIGMQSTAKKLRTQCRFRKIAIFEKKLVFAFPSFPSCWCSVSLSLCLSLVLCLYIYADLKMLEFLCCSSCWSGYIYIYIYMFSHLMYPYTTWAKSICTKLSWC
jgi:hypothetical protein